MSSRKTGYAKMAGESSPLKIIQKQARSTARILEENVKTKKKFVIFEDPENNRSNKSPRSDSNSNSNDPADSDDGKKIKTDETTTTTDPLDLMTSAEPTLEYWREVAEERRLALEETLEENQRLVEKVEELENKNRDLEDQLENATELANTVTRMIKEAGGDIDESGVGSGLEETGNNSSFGLVTEPENDSDSDTQE